MLIDYASDIHINHWIPWIPNQVKWESRTRAWASTFFGNPSGDVLVLAGDFSEFNRQIFWFVEEAAARYQRVYVTYGNHDLYLLSKKQRKKYGDSKGRLDEFVRGMDSIPGVVTLIRSIDTYKGVTFAGDAMWYCPSTEKDWSFFHEKSNDSSYIHFGHSTPRHGTEMMHHSALEWYHSLRDEPVDVMVTHVPPVHPSFAEEEENGCYITPVPFLKGNHWIAGHQHLRGTVQEGETTFHFNANGYPSEGPPTQVKTFSVKSG